jgi:hypothetical protein
MRFHISHLICPVLHNCVAPVQGASDLCATHASEGFTCGCCFVAAQQHDDVLGGSACMSLADTRKKMTSSRRRGIPSHFHPLSCMTEILSAPLLPRVVKGHGDA